MVDTHEEKKELEILKQGHKLELIKVQERVMDKEHTQKIERLNLQLEIAKAGGTNVTTEN